MKINFLRACLVAVLAVPSYLSYSQADSVKIRAYLEKIKGNEVLLDQFFTDVPKGGDIHNHLTGSAYAETYFDLAANDSLWVNMGNGKLYRTKADAKKDSVANPLRLTKTIANLHDTRMKLIDLWSIRNFLPSKSVLGPDEYFFGTFGLFSAITSAHMVDLLRELKNRAAHENVQYLEIMASSSRVNVNDIDNYNKLNQWLEKAIVNNDPSLTDTLSAIFKQWEKNAKLQKQVTSYVAFVDSIDGNSNLKNDPKAPVCLYQAYVVRNASPLSVFAQLYISFKACASPTNKKLVGVNIVSAENGEQSMLYYNGHMKMFGFLKKTVAPAVNTSLHAGELTLGLVKPEDLGNHIREAVYTAKANRIGHGVDIAFENGSISLLNEMKIHNIPVEINLVSNEFILGVKGDNHPFMLYFKSGIPLVISTDDPGILRTNLSRQYTLLELRYHVDYYDIKRLIRNGITYSFAPEKTKQSLLANLNQELTKFESDWVQYINGLVN
jgi:adenosine deaminase